MADFSKLGIDESSNLCITSSDAEWGYPLTRLDDIDFKNHKTEILVSLLYY